MSRARLLAAALLVTFACSDDRPAVRGIQTRVEVDRTETRVGDRVGVTIEIDTPRGYGVTTPDPPAGGSAFLSERVEVREPVAVPGGLRHRVLWTLRAKETGDHALPELAVPLSHPDGRMEPLPVGGTPLVVRSTREALPDREVFFDIRDAPPPQTSNAALYLGAAAALLLAAVIGAVRFRKRHGVIGEPAHPSHLARGALEELEAALARPAPRDRATGASDTLRTYAERRFSLPAQTATPRELPEHVGSDLVSLLAAFDGERFARDPRSNTVDATGDDARRYLRDVVDG